MRGECLLSTLGVQVELIGRLEHKAFGRPRVARHVVLQPHHAPGAQRDRQKLGTKIAAKAVN